MNAVALVLLALAPPEKIAAPLSREQDHMMARDRFTFTNGEAEAGWKLAAKYHNFLKLQQNIKPHWHDILEPCIDEQAWRRKCWNALDNAKSRWGDPDWWWDVLREELGEEAWWAGQMPTPLPPWYRINGGL